MSTIKYEVGDVVEFYNDGIHGIGEVFRLNVYDYLSQDTSYTVKNVVECPTAPMSTCDVGETWLDRPSGNKNCWNIRYYHILRLISKAQTKKGNTVYVLRQNKI